jgi:hypothetical protein
VRGNTHLDFHREERKAEKENVSKTTQTKKRARDVFVNNIINKARIGEQQKAKNKKQNKINTKLHHI